MNIFNNLKYYKSEPKTHIPLTEEQKKERERQRIEAEKRERREDILNTLSALGVYFLVLTEFGTLWYFGEFEFCGFMFFLLLGLIIFGLIASSFAKLSEIFDKKLGEKWGMSLGCIGMSLGPILGIIVFALSMPYWLTNKAKEGSGSYPYVYITPYGECYHKTENCYTIEGHKVKKVTLDKAERKGRRPCGICYGGNNQ